MNARTRIILTIVAVLSYVGYTYLSSESFKNPETGRSARVALTEVQETALGLQSYKQVLSESQVLTSGPEYDRVVRIAQRLRVCTGEAGAKFQWAVSVVRSPQINAFCLPGGKIVVYTGILPVAANDAQLATVMGHEMAHAVARHGSQRMLQTKLANAAVTGAQVGVSGMDYEQQRAIMGAIGAGAKYGIILPFSREHENEADYMGLLYMARAGYDPREAESFWKRMAQQSGGGGKPPEFASTHPSDDTRIRHIHDSLPAALAEYEKSRFRGQP